jgi:hypothetical protein
VAQSESIEIVTRKFLKKMMKIDFQKGKTFEILSGNGIFSPLHIKDTSLNVLKLNFRLGNVDLDCGILRKY